MKACPAPCGVGDRERPCRGRGRFGGHRICSIGDFTAEAPNRKWVTDFTYTRAWGGFVYVAFVVDCFSRSIVGWHASTVKDTGMVTTALRMALWRRDHAGHPVGDGLIQHSDAGSRYTSIAFA